MYRKRVRKETLDDELLIPASYAELYCNLIKNIKDIAQVTKKLHGVRVDVGILSDKSKNHTVRVCVPPRRLEGHPEHRRKDRNVLKKKMALIEKRLRRYFKMIDCINDITFEVSTGSEKLHYFSYKNKKSCFDNI